ncbi:hypothetical protein SYNPS1DRAFT_28737 [Syncephalis pseudoplumigaleata]|uniref:SH3 domain-containing protein n=1 Tax=Syncephalis pseudoplumigaleata TaxID=1712513 RepID=A0A4P9Z256_9FUNG|nr:hypothetical protein SYNPS1DRAFT_28737 [Syncephalis pseudoplumigaleata]|eukprot:RKP25530.1 hypothetical protein SYNPS1DRAFT_28737 [Syncephalis pseudoplumigaleata]
MLVSPVCHAAHPYEPFQLVRRQNTLTSSAPALDTRPSAATTTTSGNSAQTCFSLVNSTACPEFREAEIPTGYVINGVAVNNFAEFDKAMQSLVNANTTTTIVNKWADRCKEWSPELQPRYMLTMACGTVAFSAEAKQCAQLPASAIQGVKKEAVSRGKKDPLPVCEATCKKFTGGWIDILKNTLVCPDSGDWLVGKQNELNQLCARDEFRGQQSVCISGAVNEEDTCGFALPSNANDACEFCSKHPDEVCCRKMKDTTVHRCTTAKVSSINQAREKTNITLIICACSAAILIVVTFIMWRIRHNKHNDINQNKPPNQVYRAIFAYLPNLEDEMLLEVGDIIEIDQIFSDDWAHGCNHTTGEIGMLPMSFVTLASPGQQYQRSPLLAGEARRAFEEKRPVESVQTKSSTYTSHDSRHLSRLPSYLESVSATDRRTWHTPASRGQQYGGVPPRALSQQLSSQALSQRTTSLRRSHLHIPDISSIAPSSNYNYHSSMPSYPRSSLMQQLSSEQLHDAESDTQTDSVFIVPVLRQSSATTWDPQRSPPSPPLHQQHQHHHLQYQQQ